MHLTVVFEGSVLDPPAAQQRATCKAYNARGPAVAIAVVTMIGRPMGLALAYSLSRSGSCGYSSPMEWRAPPRSWSQARASRQSGKQRSTCFQKRSEWFISLMCATSCAAT